MKNFAYVVYNMKLPRTPYGLEECEAIVKELFGE